MKIAIDKNVLPKIRITPEDEYIYVFEDETLEELLNTNLHCINKEEIEEVDINLTKYKIECRKQADINDIDWKKMPPKKHYKYAIIVPNCNNDHGDYEGKTFLRNCIESILNQTYKNFELIIVDDMSTDTSVETAKSYKDKRIKLIENNRKRYNGGSRNVGIDYAKTTDAEYICFLDSDDWWKTNKVLEDIDNALYNQEMLILGAEMLFKNGSRLQQYNRYDTYQDVYFCLNKVWCTAWSRVIRIDKIVYFCEDTLMEDRVWSYKQADNVKFENISRLNKICYVWNRNNSSNSVSQVRNNIWTSSAWCHIGHQLQFMENMKHKEFRPILERRINACIGKIRRGEYEQY